MRELARLELLQHFGANDIEDLSALATLVEHKAGANLQSAQGTGNKVYIMKQGEAAIRAQAYRVHPGLMPLKDTQAFSRRHIPQP